MTMDISSIGILVAEDELAVRESLTKLFQEEGYTVDSAENASAALKKLQERSWNIVLLDIKMPGMDGMELLQRVREIDEHVTIIIITPFPAVDIALKALKSGAFDYVTKPINPEYLDHIVENALKHQSLARENERLRDTVGELLPEVEIIGTSMEMTNVMELVDTVAQQDMTVMIRGESGTGKELIARAIHVKSQRRYFPMVTVHCGAVTESLLETELFGHEHGAIAGEQLRTRGKIELAHGGSLVLKEIENIGMKTQVDLLRVLETKQFTRVAGSEIIRCDVRVICTTNKNLEAVVKDGTLREDLYYQLNVFSINLPPLRARPEDIVRIAHHFLEKYSHAMNRPVQGFTLEAINAMKSYHWPGNLRELENAIERAVFIADGPSIGKGDLPLEERRVAERGGKRLKDVERVHVEAILRETGWNISRSAAILAIDRVTLYNKIRKYGLKRDT